MIKKWDLVLLVVLLLLSLLPEGIFILSGSDRMLEGTKAVVQVDGSVYKEIPLSEHHGTDTFTIQTSHGYNIVVVKEQEIGMVEADCPDKICVSEGFISKPGATAVCLPHHVLIEIQSTTAEEPDIIPAH